VFVSVSVAASIIEPIPSPGPLSIIAIVSALVPDGTEKEIITLPQLLHSSESGPMSTTTFAWS